jgi:hypothetical protein
MPKDSAIDRFECAIFTNFTNVKKSTKREIPKYTKTRWDLTLPLPDLLLALSNPLFTNQYVKYGGVCL